MVKNRLGNPDRPIPGDGAEAGQIFLVQCKCEEVVRARKWNAINRSFPQQQILYQDLACANLLNVIENNATIDVAAGRITAALDAVRGAVTETTATGAKHTWDPQY